MQLIFGKIITFDLIYKRICSPKFDYISSIKLSTKKYNGMILLKQINQQHSQKSEEMYFIKKRQKMKNQDNLKGFISIQYISCPVLSLSHVYFLLSICPKKEKQEKKNKRKSSVCCDRNKSQRQQPVPKEVGCSSTNSQGKAGSTIAA